MVGENKSAHFGFRLCRLWGFIAAILLLNSSTTEAADYYWNVSSGDWSDTNPSPWSLGTEPTSSDDAYIQNGGTANITQMNEVCNSIILADSLTRTTGSAYMTGGSLTTSGESIGEYGTGTFTQNGGTHSITISLLVGYDYGSTGTYNLSGTSQLSAATELIAYRGNGTFNQNGGTNTISGNLRLSETASSPTRSGSIGIYKLSGNSQLFAESEYIGDQSDATFTQDGGVNTITGNLYLGNLGNGKRTYNLNDTGSLYLTGVHGTEYLGNTGGYIAIFNQTGGLNSTPYLDLGIGFYTCTYNLKGGTLLTKGISSLGQATFNFGGGTLKSSGSFSTSQPMKLTGDGGDVNVDTAGNSITLSGVLSGIGGLNKIGSGTLTLSSNNSFTGSVNFNGGWIKAASLNKLGNGTALNFNGGGLQFSGVYDPSVRSMTFQAGGATLDTQTYNITMANPIGNSGVGGLVKKGTGKLTLNALINFSGDTTINGGTLEFAGGIDPNGTSLIDVLSGTAVLKTVNVNKTNLNINTAALATFELVNHMHSVGTITGTGTTQVDAGASLTAQSISQGTLTIASGATLTIQAIPGGPLANPIAPVPEPSALVLLSAVFILAIYAWARKRKF